jgi:hypothetical protein
MIFIHHSAEEELCKSAVVLRTSTATPSQQETHFVLCRGSHLEVVRDAGFENPALSNAALSKKDNDFPSGINIFGQIWDMQVIVVECKPGVHFRLMYLGDRCTPWKPKKYTKPH